MVASRWPGLCSLALLSACSSQCMFGVLPPLPAVAIAFMHMYDRRLLNSLPANRATGTALVAFLQTAGYRLFMVYKGQFIKVLKYIFDNFYPKLTQVTFMTYLCTAQHWRDVQLNVTDWLWSCRGQSSPLIDHSQSVMLNSTSRQCCAAHMFPHPYSLAILVHSAVARP